MKTCQQCGRQLPLSHFHRRTSSEDGHCSVCKDFRRKYYYDQHVGIAHMLRHFTTEEIKQELARRRAAESAKTEQT